MPQPLPPPATDELSSPPRANGRPLAVSARNVAVSIGLSLVVLLVIGYFTFEPGALRQMAEALNPWLLGLAAATVIVRIWLGGVRLQYISHGRLDLPSSIRGQLAWDFFSNVTPSVIGGGPLAAVYIARDRNISYGESTALLLFAMLLDQLWFALSVPFILSAAFYFEVIPGSLGRVGEWTIVGYFLAILCWVGLFGYATLFRPDLIHQVADRLFRIRWLRRFRGRVSREMVQLRYRSRMLRSQPASFFVNAFGLTVASWIVRYLLLVLIVWSVYPPLDVWLTFMRTAAMTLGTLILPTPGGAGGVEAMYWLFMSPPVMPKPLVAPTLLTWRLMSYYIYIALGVFLSIYQVQKTMRRRTVDGPDGDPAPVPQPEPAEAETDAFGRP